MLLWILRWINIYSSTREKVFDIRRHDLLKVVRPPSVVSNEVGSFFGDNILTSFRNPPNLCFGQSFSNFATILFEHQRNKYHYPTRSYRDNLLNAFMNESVSKQFNIST